MNPITNELREGIQRQAEQKSRRMMTTEQLPVYIAAAEMLKVITGIVVAAPRKAMRFCDKAITDAAELLKCIALANLLQGEDRVYYLQVAEANAMSIGTYINIFHAFGILRKNDAASMRKQMKSVRAQIAGWRASVRRSLNSSGL